MRTNVNTRIEELRMVNGLLYNPFTIYVTEVLKMLGPDYCYTANRYVFSRLHGSPV